MIETPLSRALLKSEFVAGDTIQVDVENSQLTFTKRESVVVKTERPAETV
jgi:ATP-dependent Clp protease ATP-binding subunit ClpC